MKNLLLFFLVCSLNQVFAQQKDVITEVRTDERIFQGSINEKYAITIYLKYYQSSGEHMGVYSVKGWYYYDNIQKKIPLVGLYDNDDLTLFVFQQKEKQDSILEFNYGGANLWDGLELLKGMSGFDEKFTYNTEVKEWKTSTKKLPLRLFSDNLSIEQTTDFIKTTQNNEVKFIDMDEMMGYIDNCELVHSIHSKTENSFLVKYEFPSNPYVQGRCGAGTEEGYALLKYDGNYNFLNFQNVVLNSCYDGLSSETIASSNQNQLVFSVSSMEDKVTTITIDIAKNTITLK